MALVSSLKDIVIPDDMLAFGEIGLAGEIRSVSHAEERVKEAARLGFKKCIVPKHNLDSIKLSKDLNIKVIGVSTVREAFGAICS